MDKMNKIKKFLKNTFDNGIQAFDTRNIVGDYMINIYNEDGVSIDYAPGYEYIEIFGLTDEEYQELEEQKYIH